MRVTTAFNKILGIIGASVADVVFAPGGVVISLRRRFRRLRCPCGWSTPHAYDRSVRRWRHLDLGASRLYLEAEIRRLECRRCQRVRTEIVPWARPGARFTRDFEDVVAWLAQRTDKTSVSVLMRCSWAAVAAAVTRVVVEQLDDARLNDLYRIGVDEVSYRKGHRYLTVVVDHDRQGAVIWAGEGKSATTLEAFYDQLGADRVAKLEAVSVDMGAAFAKATRTKAPHAALCIDPFHVIQLANDAVEAARRYAWNQARGGRPATSPVDHRTRPRRAERISPQAWVKHTRWVLLKDAANLTAAQQQVLEQLQQSRHVLWRAYELKEALRDLYRLPDPALAPAHLERWLARACRSRIPAIVKLSQTLRRHRNGILAAIELGLNNGKLEGLNSKIRLINEAPQV